MTRIYRVDGKLAANIPSRVRPHIVVYDETIQESVPSEPFQATLTWFPVLVRAYTNPDRTALLLTHDPNVSPIKVLETLELDTLQPVEIRLYGHGQWLKAHLFHGRFARVWIPSKLAKRLHVRDYDFYPVLIRGMTHAQIRQRRIQREAETIIVRHLGNEYPAVKVGFSWRWELPREIPYKPPGDRDVMLIRPEELFGWYIDQGGIVEAEEFYQDDRHKILFEIHVEPYHPVQEKYVARNNGFAFRNIANRNYALKDINAYPFFCELRSSVLLAYPVIYHHAKQVNYTNKLIDMLNITVWNMAGKVLLSLAGYPFLTSKKLQSTEQTVLPLFQGVRYTRENMKHRRGREPLPDYVISEGTEVNEKIDQLEFERFPFSYCIKYCRIINKQMGYYVYDNKTIEEYARSENVHCDKEGFLWK